MARPNTSLLDYALAEIRNKILSGEYAAGSKLTSKQVADELEISQTPVKEAFNRLVSEHLLEPIPNRGFQVSSFSAEYLQGIIDARLIIEPYIAVKAVENVDKHPDTVAKLNQYLNEMIHNTGTFLEDSSSWESEFHTTFASLCENDFIINTYNQLWNISHVYYKRRMPNWSKIDKTNTPSDHIKMVECLKNRDAATLQELCKNHVSRIEQHI